MYLVLGSAAVVGAALALGLLPRLFTPDHRLRPLPRPADALIPDRLHEQTHPGQHAG